MTSVIINREDRPERLARLREQFRAYDVTDDAVVFPAIVDSPGWKGCRYSHLAVLKEYSKDKFLLVLEDDVLFLQNPRELSTLALAELPKDWDMLYYGINPQEKFTQYSEHLYSTGRGYCAHAILYNCKEGGVVDFILEHKDEIQKFDVFLADVVNKKFNCFVIFPMLCSQWQHQSDTCLRTDSSVIEKNYKQFVG